MVRIQVLHECQRRYLEVGVNVSTVRVSVATGNLPMNSDQEVVINLHQPTRSLSY